MTLAKRHYAKIAQLLEKFGDDQLRFTLELEAYEVEWSWAEKEQEIVQESKTILLPDNESSRHSLSRPKTANPILPQTIESVSSQLPPWPPRSKSHPEKSPQATPQNDKWNKNPAKTTPNPALNEPNILHNFDEA